MNVSHRYWISGRVQGVWYRGFVQEQAISLGIVGYAKNLPDGRVEVAATGSADAHQSLLSALSQGPQMANVSGVESEPLENPVEYVDFSIY